MPLIIPARLFSPTLNPGLLQIPRYLSLLCIIVGLAWLLVLPLDEYSRRTYISENALLPGQVNTYFGGTEHTVFRAYRFEVAALEHQPGPVVADKLGSIFKEQGLKIGRQKYNYTTAGRSVSGENVYGVIQGPRADATEAMVLVAAWRNMKGELNQSGVALALTLARYFKRWSLWSKDIFVVIPEDSTAGIQAWVDAYHDMHPSSSVENLPIKGGALQGGLAIDYPAGVGGHRFETLDIIYDGVNGQLPNLDLINTLVLIAQNQVGIRCRIQKSTDDDWYSNRLETVMRGMVGQGVGRPTGPHSSFMPYHVHAITLKTAGNGWHDEISLGKVVESGFRSINNLLEHLHQSFFFYILIDNDRFVSIATYLPSAMLIAVSFTLTCIVLWWESGQPDPPPNPASTESPAKGSSSEKQTGDDKMEVIQQDGMLAVVPEKMLHTLERNLFAPVALLGAAYFLGLCIFFIFNATDENRMSQTFYAVSTFSSAIPLATGSLLKRIGTRQILLMNCLSLLLLGAMLATLSTLNYSLGFFTGLAASPLSFTHLLLSKNPPAPNSPTNDNKINNSKGNPRPSKETTTLSATSYLLLLAISPPAMIQLFSALSHSPVRNLLLEASAAWTIHGTYTALVVWVVWWPAWFVGAATVGAALAGG